MICFLKLGSLRSNGRALTLSLVLLGRVHWAGDRGKEERGKEEVKKIRASGSKRWIWEKGLRCTDFVPAGNIC